MIALLATALARPDVAVVISDELAPYNAPVPAFVEAIGVPVQTIGLNGRESEAETEIDGLRRSDPRVVFALGAKAAYAVRHQMPDTPLVYAQVLEPARYGIPGPQTTGIRARVPDGTYLSQVQVFFPAVASVGVIRGKLDPAEARGLRNAARELGLTLEIREVGSPKEFRREFHALVDEVDAIWLTPERGILSKDTFRMAVQEMQRVQKPLLSDTQNMVSAGAAFAVTPSAAGVGRQAADLTKQILEGASPGTIEVQDPEDLATSLNVRTLEAGPVPYESLMLDFAEFIVD